MPAFCVRPKRSPLGPLEEHLLGQRQLARRARARGAHLPRVLAVPSLVEVPPTISSKPMLRAGAAMDVSYLPESRRLMRFSITWVTAEKSSLPQPLSSASS